MNLAQDNNQCVRFSNSQVVKFGLFIIASFGLMTTFHATYVVPAILARTADMMIEKLVRHEDRGHKDAIDEKRFMEVMKILLERIDRVDDKLEKKD